MFSQLRIEIETGHGWSTWRQGIYGLVGQYGIDIALVGCVAWADAGDSRVAQFRRILQSIL